MPKIPTKDSIGVQTQVMPNQQFNAAALTPESASAGMRQVGAAGQALVSAGQGLEKIVEHANSVRVDDALNQLKEKQLTLTYGTKEDRSVGFLNQTGINALQRKSGKSLTDDYTETFDKSTSDISTELGNDAQRAMFTQRAKDMRLGFMGQTMKHEGDQFKEYTVSVRDGTVANGIRDIELNYDNPDAVASSIELIKAASYDKSQLLGKSAEWTEAQTRKLTSEAHKVAMAAAIDKNNPEYAEGYLKKFSKDMEGDDILKVQGLITKEMDKKVGLNVATSVITQISPSINPTSMDRAFGILTKTESGGRQFDKEGNPITSAKGAIGIAQVMPATGPEAAKIAGVDWDEAKFKTDPNYNAALGRAYFNQQLKNHEGKLDQAYAAYNAGPGAVQKAIKEANAHNSIPMADAANTKSYLDFLPQETQDYVAKNMKAYNAGAGAPDRPSLLEIHQAVREKLGPGASTERMKVAIDETTRQYEEIDKAVKQRDEQAVANAQREIVANGGKFAALSPATLQALPPGQHDDIREFAKKIASNGTTTNLAVYQKLSDSSFLGSLSDDQFYRMRAELDEGDFKHFSNERSKIKGGGASDRPDDLNSAAIKGAVDIRLRSLGEDPTPKEESKQAIQVATVRKYINDRVSQKQREDGKRMSDVETSKFVDTLFLENAMRKGGWFSADKTGRKLDMRASDIPVDTRKMIEQDFKNRGHEVSDSEVLEAYWLLTSRKK